ncbi:MAG: hypothetical protein KTR27_02540 [Leptolyngbyaceae cyanobacterium MAG.088]|nr:hypothetical protein [Leptolyngbyaceae cyanobacterium MAG.088]
MGDRIQSFWQNRLPKTVQKAVQKAPVASPGENLTAPAPAILNYLRAQVGKLPPPLPCQHALKKALAEAIRVWQADPEIANNSLVVLGRPVEDVARIIKTSVQTASDDDDPSAKVLYLLGGYHRPSDPLEMNQHIRRALTLQNEAVANQEADAPEEEAEDAGPTIVVVPRLEQLFLRCIQGWEGIEYLQNLTTRDTSRFWVFGCNYWAWAFLDRVCQVSAYLEQPFCLPELSGEDLKAWLSPVVEASLTMPESDESVQIEAVSDSYWNTLSNASSGIGATAARLWLASLRSREKVDDESTSGETNRSETGSRETNTSQNGIDKKRTDDSASEESGDAESGDEGSGSKKQPLTTLVTIKPTLPSLIGLDVMDRYVLHTLLIHGDMTRSHLALSLGEAERKIRARLQVLRREGIILQRGRRLSIHPAYYPKLYSELKNNNFLIGMR